MQGRGEAPNKGRGVAAVNRTKRVSVGGGVGRGVVPMLSPRKKLSPSLGLRASKVTQISINAMVYHFSLPFSLRIIGGAHFEGSALTFEEGLSKITPENLLCQTQ